MKELPRNGLGFPQEGTDQYPLSTYIHNTFHLSSPRYRRFNPLTNGLEGAKDALIHTLKGMHQVIAHPIETAGDVGYAVMHPHQVLGGVWDKIKSNTANEGLANTVGGTGFELGTLLTPVGVGKAVSAAGRASSRIATSASASLGAGAKAGSAGAGAGSGAAAVGASALGAVGVGLESAGQLADVVGQIADARDLGREAHARQMRVRYLERAERD